MKLVAAVAAVPPQQLGLLQLGQLPWPLLGRHYAPPPRSRLSASGRARGVPWVAAAQRVVRSTAVAAADDVAAAVAVVVAAAVEPPPCEPDAWPG